MHNWEIDGKTRLYGLLGSPVSHSLSPFIHNEGFRRLSLNARYLAFRVGEKELEGTLFALRKMQVGGLNLTMPLKEAVLPLCDNLSKEARLSFRKWRNDRKQYGRNRFLPYLGSGKWLYAGQEVLSYGTRRRRKSSPFPSGLYRSFRDSAFAKSLVH